MLNAMAQATCNLIAPAFPVPLRCDHRHTGCALVRAPIFLYAAHECLHQEHALFVRCDKQAELQVSRPEDPF